MDATENLPFHIWKLYDYIGGRKELILSTPNIGYLTKKSDKLWYTIYQLTKSCDTLEHRNIQISKNTICLSNYPSWLKIKISTSSIERIRLKFKIYCEDKIIFYYLYIKHNNHVKYLILPPKSSLFVENDNNIELFCEYDTLCPNIQIDNCFLIPVQFYDSIDFSNFLREDKKFMLTHFEIISNITNILLYSSIDYTGKCKQKKYNVKSETISYLKIKNPILVDTITLIDSDRNERINLSGRVYIKGYICKVL